LEWDVGEAGSSGEQTGYIAIRGIRSSYVLAHIRHARFKWIVNKYVTAMEGIMARVVKSTEETGAVALEVNDVRNESRCSTRHFRCSTAISAACFR
jgi:hypothetical protein